jgi:hypothetical protein
MAKKTKVVKNDSKYYALSDEKMILGNMILKRGIEAEITKETYNSLLDSYFVKK